MAYRPTIGLEVHVELKTRTKMFCDSLNDPNERRPNTNVCPVCLAHPGTLPTINRQAVEFVIRVGLALRGTINPVTKFDRKNYFYPDLPKGYQISQYDQPLVVGGMLEGVRIRRIHLEEDTGRLVHATSDKGQAISLVDFNRAGVPLMELVTEPDITSVEQASEFARELQLILRYLGVSDADMESGQMRIEANVSVGQMKNDKLHMGTKVELKNINSFKAMEDAVRYELARHEEVLESGGTISQETRGWDEAKQKSVVQRIKEDAHDYRYFPEPDLPPFETDFFNLEKLKAELPELPAKRRERFVREYGLNEAQADTLVGEPALADYFEEAVSELKEKSPQASVLTLFNYLTSDIRGIVNELGIVLRDTKVNPEHLAHLVFLIESGKLTSRQAKDMLAKMFKRDEDPEDILKDESLYAISGTAELETIAQFILQENPAAIADYRKGKVASLQFLIGKAMARLKGKGNPEVLKEIFLKLLK
ncbi:MAG: glutaminyl-tRNA synthase (glutamine-hydrolyzing) subunit B [Candidatus Ryanbacteria bacterium RIFCSPLOWO2_01_FULL_48_26]|uniref:Aspartyl/glutamyl-tRNA(Asn/Gln) amidotransferase subunit B n=1 Tax=Candidatus Ryanbacteria bacterium RIFCSPLOWO2_01_FULL_48_26 TaxID=1802126 RepID=A0A1G2GX43_9BACT|nr:MAG: glutaminyl-tRNA synthase (glutamine-hydrolyzing) subunit B [Candidatus Ryanbacteria bacterium RIFCSPLOWO2_01_FULL_48_26]